MTDVIREPNDIHFGRLGLIMAGLALTTLLAMMLMEPG